MDLSCRYRIPGCNPSFIVAREPVHAGKSGLYNFLCTGNTRRIAVAIHKAGLRFVQSRDLCIQLIDGSTDRAFEMAECIYWGYVDDDKIFFRCNQIPGLL
jgi:hypothetical protein